MTCDSCDPARTAIAELVVFPGCGRSKMITGRSAPADGVWQRHAASGEPAARRRHDFRLQYRRANAPRLWFAGSRPGKTRWCAESRGSERHRIEATAPPACTDIGWTAPFPQEASICNEGGS